MLSTFVCVYSLYMHMHLSSGCATADLNGVPRYPLNVCVSRRSDTGNVFYYQFICDSTETELLSSFHFESDCSDDGITLPLNFGEEWTVNCANTYDCSYAVARRYNDTTNQCSSISKPYMDFPVVINECGYNSNEYESVFYTCDSLTIYKNADKYDADESCDDIEQTTYINQGCNTITDQYTNVYCYDNPIPTPYPNTYPSSTAYPNTAPIPTPYPYNAPSPTPYPYNAPSSTPYPNAVPYTKEEGLSPGAIAGITIAVIIVLVLGILGVVYYIRKQNKNDVKYDAVAQEKEDRKPAPIYIPEKHQTQISQPPPPPFNPRAQPRETQQAQTVPLMAAAIAEKQLIISTEKQAIISTETQQTSAPSFQPQIQSATQPVAAIPEQHQTQSTQQRPPPPFNHRAQPGETEQIQQTQQAQTAPLVAAAVTQISTEKQGIISTDTQQTTAPPFQPEIQSATPPPTTSLLHSNKSVIQDWIQQNTQLSEIDASKYADILIENGFDDLKLFQEITTDDLKEIGIKKLGHRKLIIKAIQNEKQ